MTIDDKKMQEGGLALYADGVNAHAFLAPRGEFRKLVEGARQNSFLHSLLGPAALHPRRDHRRPLGPVADLGGAGPKGETAAGGHAGGQVVVAGTPEQVAACKASHTGRFLKAHLRGANHRKPQTRRRGMKIRAVDFVSYGVSDMDKALAFYRDTLGLKLEMVYENTWAEFSVGAVTLALVGPPWGTPPQPGYQGGATVALAVDDVGAGLEELRAKGIAVLDGPQDTPVCHMALIADPDGNRLWLHWRKDGTCG